MCLKFQWWACAVMLGILHLTESAFLRCYYSGISLQNYEEVPLDEAATILDKPVYNSTRRNFMYTFGIFGKTNGTATTSVILEALRSDDQNVWLLNWEKEASDITVTKSLEPFSKQATYVMFGLPQMLSVGTAFGRALVKMAKAGLDLSATHLAAHSLGAHLFGQAGRTVKSFNLLIPRITGLDPAGPFFSNPTVLPSLASDCAGFVLSIHTDPGLLIRHYGMNASRANIDIYPNPFTQPDLEDQVQPGCPVGKFEKFSDDDMCSHNRSWMLLIESWKLNHTLQAVKAANYSDWAARKGNPSDTITLGDDLDTTSRKFGNLDFVENKIALTIVKAFM